MNRQDFFINDYDRIFTVKLAWNIKQPFVCNQGLRKKKAS